MTAKSFTYSTSYLNLFEVPCFYNVPLKFVVPSSILNVCYSPYFRSISWGDNNIIIDIIMYSRACNLFLIRIKRIYSTK